MKHSIIFVVTLVIAATVAAQISPYVDHQQRNVKALSPDEVAGYLAGAGMGFAKPAELNHYPGPKHVLHMAESLELSDDQRRRTEAVYERMAQAARRLGRQVVDAESALDEMFKGQQADADVVKETVAAIADLRGQLRYAHIEAHLAMKDILSEEQVRRYDEQRGYGGGEH